MKSVTYVRKSTVAKYGMGCIATDVLREGWLLQAASKSCPPNTVPRVRAINWVTFKEIATSRPLRQACLNSGMRLDADVAGFCAKYAVNHVPESLDEVVVCNRACLGIRAALGLSQPGIPPDDGCCCTVCKHGLTAVVVEPDGTVPEFTGPGDCVVASCRDKAGLRELTMIIPCDPDVCGAQILMDRVPGETARRLVRANPERAPEVCRMVFEALARLHRGGVAHNDSKLDNFVVDLATGHAVCIDLELATTAECPGHNLIGTVSDAAGIEIEWSKDSQRCDATQVCIAFRTLCGSLAPAFCASIATLAEPFKVDGHLNTPIYFQRGPKSAFVTASVAATAIAVEHGRC